MPTYLITNRVPDGFTPSPEAFAAWTAWFDSLGDVVADRGNPAFASTTAGNCGPGTTLGGYTLITAGDGVQPGFGAHPPDVAGRVGEVTEHLLGRRLDVHRRGDRELAA